MCLRNCRKGALPPIAILCHTTPIDVLSLVSKTFLSAIDSDIVWNHFLPADSHFIDSIISQYPSLATAPTKKALISLYLIILSSLTMLKRAFNWTKRVERSVTCLLLEWIHMQNSRSPEVAKLCRVLSFEIRGMINTLSLSPNTKYAAYLVFKMIDARGFEDTSVELSVGIEGGHCNTKFVCLERWRHSTETHHHCSKRRPNSNARCKCPGPGWRSRNIVRLKRPKLRIDGWLEIKMGEFFNSSLKDEEVYMSVIQKKSSGIKENLFLQGIEIRPAKDN